MKKILITGAGSGLGKELAKCYGKEKNHIILIGRTLSKLEEIAKKIQETGGTAESIVCDITDIKDIENLKNQIAANHKKIDYLINNAGVGYFGPIEKITIEEMNIMIDTNAKGTIMMTKTLLPYIEEKIINIISTAGLVGKVNETAYVASKFAVRGFTESLQKELAHKPLKIIPVYMGGMNTPFWQNSNHIEDENILRNPKDVAEEIIIKDDGRTEIIID